MLTIEWSPVIGCSPVSPGCLTCYARKTPHADGLTRLTPQGPVWNGKTRLDDAALRAPLLQPQRAVYVVCPHGDLFHESTSDEKIDRVFNVMEHAGQHLFQLMTKRAARQRSYISNRYRGGMAPEHIIAGVSVDVQAEALRRLPELFSTPVKHRFITFFPLLEAIDLLAVPGVDEHFGKLVEVNVGQDNTRPADPAWVETIASVCRRYGVRLDGNLIRKGPCLATGRWNSDGR